MAGDFIKLSRSLLGWEWYDDVNTCRLFIHLLLIANWKDGKWHGETIKRGQKVTSLSKLSEETGLTVQQVRTSLKRLKSTGEVTSKTTNRYTVVTINNYDKYQDANKQDNKQTTNKQQTNNNQLTTIEEREEDKNRHTTATTRESQLKRLFRFYEENNFGVLAPYIAEDITRYIDGGVSADLIERCMKEAVASGSPNWKYTVKILERCRTQKIETPEQFEAEKKKREAERAAYSGKCEKAKPNYSDPSEYENLTMDV